MTREQLLDTVVELEAERLMMDLHALREIVKGGCIGLREQSEPELIEMYKSFTGKEPKLT